MRNMNAYLSDNCPNPPIELTPGENIDRSSSCIVRDFTLTGLLPQNRYCIVPREGIIICIHHVLRREVTSAPIRVWIGQCEYNPVSIS